MNTKNLIETLDIYISIPIIAVLAGFGYYFFVYIFYKTYVMIALLLSLYLTSFFTIAIYQNYQEAKLWKNQQNQKK